MTNQNPMFSADGVPIRFPRDWNGNTAHVLCVVEKVDEFLSKNGSDGITHVVISPIKAIKNEAIVTIYSYCVGQASCFILGDFKFSELDAKPLFLDKV